MLRALLLLLPLAACAVPPAPVALGPPLPYPPSVRTRLLAIAQAEWAEWGSIVADPEAPPRLEARPENFPRLVAYWNAVPGDEGALSRNRAIYAQDPAHPPGNLWAEPAWSAAFISYVMQRAGVDRREFRPNASHALYLDPLLSDAAAFPATAPFIPYRPQEYAPRLGDLVCGDRSRNPLTDWTQRLAEAGRFRPMHCDIVVGLSPGFVEAIGGNVADAVTLSRFPADEAGLLLPRPAGRTQWLVVMRNRLGELPPFGGMAVSKDAAGR
ncbi:DUF2272 domain-containing protein [Rhodovarius crocodyli]|uniref:DUF2272 domain-containing protein n=1 Tax=Rhodovarius crocodyli TaxID=1979269 RepID=A0A437MDV0_9PROT|nr:DUF2272 domain-containing protein [Rhodovarius crocodyli]RVT95776.1 DUF2272 domain-containing protein [Rhodovarius crocodyli]